MTRWPRLSHAPVVEGLIDIRIERSPAADLASLRAACEELAPEFPSCQERRSWAGQITLGPQTPVSLTTQKDEPDGFILRSADERTAVQFRLDGFTFSRLHPYTSWDDLKARSMALWARYRDIAHPAKVLRVAVRFINRIPLTSGASLDQTFTTIFSVSASLPQAVAGFLLRVAIPFEAEQAMAILSQTLDTDGNHCVFDIDVFSESATGFGEDEAWAKIEVFRDIKNRLFFESLTPKTLESLK